MISSPRTLSLLLLTVLCPPCVFAEDSDVYTESILPLFRQHCVKCHGEKGVVKGKVNLLALQTDEDLFRQPQLISDLIDALELEVMPPEDEPAVDPELRKRSVLYLKSRLAEQIRSRSLLAQTPIRRMNRFQYSNAVQDLFELNAVVFALPEKMLREHRNYFQPQTGKMPPNLFAGSRPLGKSQLIENRLAGVGPFPQDLRAEHGFDNRGDHLSLSPLLLESFMKLSRSIVESRDFHDKTCGIWHRFFVAPEGKELEPVVRERLRVFLTRAFRAPVSDTLLDRYTEFVMTQIRSGQSFTESMKDAASAAIASPRFLYLYDGLSTSDRPEKLNDFELASRLSFFLWGSIPDQTLLDLAAAGTLHQPQVFETQITRMLKDRKLKRFCDSFPTQWLQLERIISSIPDQKLHPEFYFARYRVSMHMMLEPLLVFETILIENRSILELIHSDFSYRSPLLQSWYKTGKRGRSAPPTQIPFKRVPIESLKEGGVVTTAAVMTMTSSPTRTQPITRGAWVASVLFNDPPEPPPADVPPLPETKPQEMKDLTIRERLAVHRKQVNCAGCHNRIDPLGFALENYGPTGLWREQYTNGRDVDASGVLFGKHKFQNAVEFKTAVLAEKDRFATGFAEHLLSFSLGRELTLADAPAVQRIVERTIADDYRFQTMIKEIVFSEPFLHKYNPPKELTTNAE